MGFIRTACADIRAKLSCAYAEAVHRRSEEMRTSRYNAASAVVSDYAYQMQTELFALLSEVHISDYLVPIHNRNEIVYAGYFLKEGHIILKFKLMKSDAVAIPREELNKVEKRINMLFRQQRMIQRQPDMCAQAYYYTPLTFLGMCMGFTKDGRSSVTFCVASNGEPSPDIIRYLRR